MSRSSSLLAFELLLQKRLARCGRAEDIMKGEAAFLVDFALCVLVELFLQCVDEFGPVLLDDFDIVGHVAQRIVIVERLVRARKSDAVGALVVGEWGRAVALGELGDLLFGTVFERVVVAGGETSDACEGQEEW